MYRLARLVNSVAFLPLAQSPRTHRNAILLKTCKRTLSLLFVERKTEIVLPAAARLSSPRIHAGAFRRDLVKTYDCSSYREEKGATTGLLYLCDYLRVYKGPMR